jgi:hypothetical protein
MNKGHSPAEARSYSMQDLETMLIVSQSQRDLR